MNRSEWGLLAGSSWVIGPLIATWFHIPLRMIGLIMGFGAGVLISSVAFDLVEEAAEKSTEAFAHGGELVGVVTTLGFATAYGIHALS